MIGMEYGDATSLVLIVLCAKGVDPTLCIQLLRDPLIEFFKDLKEIATKLKAE
jgi:hypothetical protein